MKLQRRCLKVILTLPMQAHDKMSTTDYVFLFQGSLIPVSLKCRRYMHGGGIHGGYVLVHMGQDTTLVWHKLLQLLTFCMLHGNSTSIDRSIICGTIVLNGYFVFILRPTITPSRWPGCLPSWTTIIINPCGWKKSTLNGTAIIYARPEQ